MMSVEIYKSARSGLPELSVPLEQNPTSFCGSLFQVVSLHLGNGKVKNITKEEALLIKELEVLFHVHII